MAETTLPAGSRVRVCVALAVVLAVALTLALTVPDRGQAAPGDIVVADFHAFGGPGGVIRVDPVTGARRTLSENAAPLGGPSFFNPGDIALEPDGHLVVADLDAFDGTGGVIRIDPRTGARTTVSANGVPAGGPSFSSPSSIVVAPDGDIFVADRGAFAGSGGVIRVNPATGARTALSANAAPAGGPSFVEPAGIALTPAGKILVADEDAFEAGSGGVIRVDRLTGARTTLSQNAAPAGGPSFEEPVDVAVAADGDLLVTDEDAYPDGAGGVIRVDPLTGERATVSANGAPAGGPSFAQPYGIAISPGGDILVADFDAFGGGGGVIRVDRATGARSTLSAIGTPAGAPDFADPVALALVPPLEGVPPPATPKPVTVPPGDGTAPVIRSASVRPSTFAVAGASPAVGRGAARRRAPRGTAFRLRLSEAARVTFTIDRRSGGRRVGGRCRRRTPANRGRRPCTRYVRAGTLSHRGTAGSNHRPFTGRVRGRRLRPGVYRATLRATDAARNRSRPRRLRFRVVRG